MRTEQTAGGVGIRGVGISPHAACCPLGELCCRHTWGGAQRGVGAKGGRDGRVEQWQGGQVLGAVKGSDSWVIRGAGSASMRD